MSGIICFAGIAACGQSENNAVPTQVEAGGTPLPVDISNQDFNESEVSPTPLPVPTKITPIPTIAVPSVSDPAAPTENVSSVTNEDFLNSTPLPDSSSASTVTPTPTTADIFSINPEVSYQKVSNVEGVDVYFSEDKENPQVIVYRDGQYHSFDWDYHLDYGIPVVTVKNIPHVFDGKQALKVLSIAVPVQDVDETLSPIHAREICGTEYLLDYNALAQDIPKEWIMVQQDDPEKQDFIEFEYRNNKDKEKVFTLTIHDRYNDKEENNRTFEFPGLTLKNQKQFTAVYSDMPHFTENGIRYRKFGVSDGEKTVWLGMFCNSYFFPDQEIGYYAEWAFRLPEEPEAKLCQLQPILSESLLDINGDGTPEKVIYQIEACEDTDYCSLVITADGVKTKVGEFLWSSIFKNCLFAASLDGKTSQLMLLNFNDSPEYFLRIYACGKDGFYEAGILTNVGYGVREEEGKFFFSCLEQCHPLQNDVVEVEYEFVQGYLQKTEKEYYKFLETWGYENIPADRNILTVLKDFELYTEKNGKETFIVSEGSHVITLGGDLKDWILIKDQDTGKQGWLKVKWNDYGLFGGYWASVCILPDKTVVPCEDLFEGLLNYG